MICAGLVGGACVRMFPLRATAGLVGGTCVCVCP